MIYLTVKHGITIEREVRLVAQNNVIASNQKRSASSYGLSLEVTGAFNFYSTNNFVVTDNIVMGSENDGFIMRLVSCGAAHVFERNVAMFHAQGVVYNPNGACSMSKDLSLIGNNIGVMLNPSNTFNLTVTRLIASDNTLSYRTRAHMDSLNPSFTYKDVKFLAFSRETSKVMCPHSAFTLLHTSMNAEHLPLKVVPTSGFDIQCTGSPFEGRLIVKNAIIKGYNDDNMRAHGCDIGYTIMPGSQNEMFPPTSIINSELQESNKEKLFFFPTPAGALGWLGGCGVMTCTGGNNTVVRDIDGKFLGAVSQVLPNNDMGKNLTNCIRRNTWNGYECQGYTVGQIVFENNGRDATSKISFPVEMRSRDGRFSNTINGQMEWAWNGAEPLNKRLNRFSGILPYDLHYDLIYTSGAPGMTRYKIIQQQESGGDNRYFIFSTIFALNMSVQVNTNKGIIDHIHDGKITDKIECGRNSFDNLKN